ncbi:MAG: hypothetical protein IJD13_01305, partial [Oscillospiraceae bacterium]|nr:hypothetical protein [Oscillospiraceae bacterium]
MKKVFGLICALMLAAVSLSLPVSAEGCDHTIRKPFSADNTTLSGYHNLYLAEDTELSETLKIIRSTGNATYIDLCLNGYTLSLAKEVQGSVINCQDSVLHICDCSEK